MRVVAHAVISQEKLSSLETDFIRRVLSRDKVVFHKFGGSVAVLNRKLRKKLNPMRRWSPGARDLLNRIAGIISESVKEETDHVRFALYVGPEPQLHVRDLGIPTGCALLDPREGIIRQGWIHGTSPFADGAYEVPLGMEIVFQRTDRPYYEDWVGMGAGADVVYSITDRQWDRAWNEERDIRPFINQAVLLAAAPS